MSRIELQKINKFYEKNHVLKDLDLTINDGEFMTLIGPSGCGKTTTLRVVSGLEKPQSGRILMGGEEIVNAEEYYFAPPSKRGLNLVFQSYALWPHMTVFDNVAFGLTVKRVGRDEIKRKVHNALERMRIEKYVKRYPSELSGGQQQRVAIARAIVSEPNLLLLDEPLSNLDAKLRVDMRSEIKRLHEELGTTVIYVTHDQVEALTMSTRIAVFFEGVLAQVDSPMNVYNNPQNLRVADFIGNPRINLLKARAELHDGKVAVSSDFGTFSFARADFLPETPAFPFDCQLGIRPEQIAISQTKKENAIPAAIYTSMPAGSETLIQLKADKSKLLAKELGISNYRSNEAVFLNIDPDHVNVFDGASGNLIKRAK